MVTLSKLNFKLINFALIAIILFLFSKTITFIEDIFTILKNITLPIIISFVISYVINTFSKMIKINKNISRIIIIILIIFILYIIFYFSIPILLNQIISLSFEIEYFFNNTNIDLSFLKNIFLKETNNIINSFLSFNLVSKSITTITNIIIIFVLSIFFTFKMDLIKEKIRLFLLSLKKDKLYNIIKNIDISLSNYLKGLGIIVIIEMIEYTCIYYLVGHPNFLLLGFLAGITTFIPYFGGLFTNIIALITSFCISKKLFIICLIIAIVVPIIDGYVIDPKIYEKTNRINPLKVIISLVICSNLFGVIGVLIAIPFYIIVEEIIKELIKKDKT